MGIKSTTGDLVPEKQEKPFPKLVIYRDGCVVLLQKKRDSEESHHGVVVSVKPGSRYHVGYVENWYTNKETGVKDFEGSVTLSNE